MGSTRSGEHGITPAFRSKRVYRANGRWFFDSREGPQFGPFRNRAEATRALAVFIAQHAHEAPSAAWDGGQLPGAQDGIPHMVQEVVEVLRCYRDYGPLAARTWANSRLEELESDAVQDVVTRECIGVLRYAMDHPEQTYDFAVFLENRA